VLHFMLVFVAMHTPIYDGSSKSFHTFIFSKKMVWAGGVGLYCRVPCDWTVR
jgi:hypothetical protein